MKSLEFLKNAGLSSNESFVYKILLEHSKLPVKDLIKMTKLKRGNLYNILYSLEDKKLIEEFDYKKIKHFRASHPKRIKELVSERETELRNVSQTLDDVLPSLIEKYESTSEKPGVHFHNGQDGLDEIYRMILEDGVEVRALLGKTLFSDKDSIKYLKKQFKRQDKKDIKTRIVLLDDMSKQVVSSMNVGNLTSRSLEDGKIASNIIVFGDKVVFISKKKDFFVTLLVDAGIAKCLSMVLDVVFSSANEIKDSDATKNKPIRIKINYNK